ncbi:hypothetical protein D3C76_1502150 [compost metagenome]
MLTFVNITPKGFPNYLINRKWGQAIHRAWTQHGQMLFSNQSTHGEGFCNANCTTLQDYSLRLVFLDSLKPCAHSKIEFSCAVYHLSPGPGIHRECMIRTDTLNVISEMFLDDSGSESYGP